MLVPVLTPHGLLTLAPSPDAAEEAPALEPARGVRLEQAFARGAGHGLLGLGADEVGTTLPPTLSYWRKFGARYVTALCALPGIGERSKPPVPIPADGELDTMVAAVPPMTGAEYLTTEVLANLWRDMDPAFDAELAQSTLTVQAFLKSRHPAWNLVGRVHFNLAENRKDEDAPFAFLATYTTRLSAEAKPQHLPLGKAMQEYAGARNRERLLSLLMPVQRAAEHCPWLKAMVDGGEIYHPLRWNPQQALQFLRDVPALEGAGVVVRMPATWRMNRPARPQVTATVGSNVAVATGDGCTARLPHGRDARWRKSHACRNQTVARAFRRAGLDPRQVGRGRSRTIEPDARAIRGDRASRGQRWPVVRRGDAHAGRSRHCRGWGCWAIRRCLERDRGRSVVGRDVGGLRHPDGLSRVDPGRSLQGTLRPYQLAGVQWLHLLARLRLGACLADDMGLGKTIQVLSLLLVLKNEAGEKRKPCLLVAPASLLANWAAEIARFAPSLDVIVAHPSAMPAEKLTKVGTDNLGDVDLVITSYGFLARLPSLEATSWRLAVLDEAQAIKNPAAKQTRSVKQLKAEARVALTGTPIENRLSDLWSIFDFINPGLLGSSKEFSSYVKRLADQPQNPYGPLRDLVRPYILRRLKTDKSIIADLPDKTEVKTFCPLSRKQAALYQQAVEDLAGQLENVDGIKRRGIVLAFLMRLKQICNHPSQWLGDGAWAEEDSGKFARLRDIAEVVGARQEKALVFTQFKETTAPLAAFLGSVFGRSGLVLHGETEVRKRKDLVRQFQEDERVPFFVLSVKAGGTGLNLTAASHVIHFDRWWNPAVENQATDRAFRIGQNKNVLVHKFICRGTVEDKIDQMIEFEAATCWGFPQRRC